MFGIELGEMFTLGVVALLIFGPERLPEVAVKAAHFIRKMRGAAESARSELTTSFGSEFEDLDLRDLNPRTFVRRHVLDPADDDGVLRALRNSGNGSSAAKSASGAATGKTLGGASPMLAKEQGSALPPAMSQPVLPAGERPPFDVDAT